MKRFLIASLLVLFLWSESTHAAIDPNERGLLLVCPKNLIEATIEWRAFREKQGWHITTVTPDNSATGSLEIVRQAARFSSPPIEAVLLIGDGEAIGPPAVHVTAEAIDRWGPEQEIATDRPYGDFDSDGNSDSSVGRIPINHATTLRCYLHRVVQREHRTVAWSDGQVHLVAGIGGFSPLIDMAIERTAALLINRLTPSATELAFHRCGAHPLSSQEAGLTQSSLAWVYLGHGMRNFLPSCDIRPAAPEKETSGDPDLAVLIACYSGDFTAPGKCVAEQLLTAKNGPLAVIAATRVSMPYGNTVVGARLLAGLGGSEKNMGELLRSATDATVEEEVAEIDQAGALLVEVRPLAAMLIGPDADLDAECRDHANMYCLLGDPLLALRRPESLLMEPPDRVLVGQTANLKIESKFAGVLRCAFSRRGSSPRVTMTHVREGKSIVPITLSPSAMPGTYRLTVTLVGENEERMATAGAEVRVATQRLASKKPSSSMR